MIWVASVLVRLGDKPNKKEGCGCCPASSSLLPAAHISFSGNSTHMDTCTFPYWALTGRRRGGGGRLIKTLRAVLDLTGWVKHTKHSLLLISTKNMPAHWCVYSFKASHTPKRYHFLCQPAKLQLFFFFSFLSISATFVWETEQDKDTVFSFFHFLSRSNTKPVSAQIWAGRRTRCAA